MRRNGWTDHAVGPRGMVHHGLATGVVLRHLARRQWWTGFSHVGKVWLPRGHEALVGSIEGANGFEMLLDFSLHARDIPMQGAFPVGYDSLEES
jgi:hypothetical protein